MERHDATIAFVKTLFEHTEGDIYFCSLANERGDPSQPTERRCVGRDIEKLTQFIERWDYPGRGLFFCVTTMAEGRRLKTNARELMFLYSDIDLSGVDATEADVRAALTRLRCPPSVQVFSGHGLHLYWLFNEPLDVPTNVERIEAALRQLADVVAGDLAVCEVSRLMRLPGSHNTKRGDWIKVVAEPLEYSPRYELSDLEDWLAETSPVLRRRAAAGGVSLIGHAGDNATPAKAILSPVPDNPFLAAALAQGFKPPVDVEARIRAMAYGGPGDSAIHTTQLSVSASLLSAGQEVQEVVDFLLGATREAAGELGRNWHWGREEAAIRKMCETWLAKHPSKPPRAKEPRAELPPPPPQNTDRLTADGGNISSDPGGSPPDNVTDLGAARAKKKAKPKQRKGDTPLHITVAEAALEGMEKRGQRVMFTDTGGHIYRDGLWTMETSKTLEPWLDRLLEECAQGLSLDSSSRTINEARKWIIRSPGLYRAEVPWDAHGMVPTLSGLVDPRTGAATPAAPEHYATWRVPFAYDEAAPCPLWLQMLADMFADRDSEALAQTIQLIQELLGMGLIDAKPKALSKAMVLWGPQDSAKSGALEVMAGLFGPNRNTTALALLDSPHGTIGFLERRPWLLHEAFEQSVWHLSSIVKSIVSGDEVSINVKNGPMLSRRFVAAILWGTNHSPLFKDASKAVIDRLVILPCRQNFPQEAPRGVALVARAQGYDKPHELVLATEAEGVLAWAVEGLRRALARGYFILPAEAKTAARDVRLDSNPVAEFIEDCLVYDPNRMVGIADFNAAFASWWEDHRGEDRGPGPNRVKKLLQSLGDQRIASDRKDLRDTARRYYAGIAFNAEGERRWKTIVQSDAFTRPGKNASTTLPDDNPNRTIPADWADKIAIRVMRAAHSGLVIEFGAPREAMGTNNDQTEPDPGLVIERSSNWSSTQPPEGKRKTLF
jgi:hypothetical protein